MSETVKEIIKSVASYTVRFVRWIIRKVKASEVRPYLLPLKTLIQETELRFMEGTGMKTLPRCPFCEKLMMFRHSKIVTSVGPVRDDMVFKCVSCFHTAHFGIPMTREDALTSINVRGGPTLMRPSERPDEDGLDVVTERLRRLGYLE